MMSLLQWRRKKLRAIFKMQMQTSKNISISKFLKKQSSLETLRFITCGSVDDGKSTLIGRMLFESQLIFDDQITSLKNDSKKRSLKQYGYSSSGYKPDVLLVALLRKITTIIVRNKLKRTFSSVKSGKSCTPVHNSRQYGLPRTTSEDSSCTRGRAK